MEFDWSYRERVMKESDVQADRLREVRIDTYNECGGLPLAHALGIPARALANYESGITLPDLMLLDFIELTGV